jgi:hypothetical protein
MAKVKLIFYGTEGYTVDHELECFCNADGEIYISIDTGDIPPSWICLDKSTAIKFAKTIRTEINKIEEGSNG